jgi:hypothetical protein
MATACIHQGYNHYLDELFINKNDTSNFELSAKSLLHKSPLIQSKGFNTEFTKF